MLPNCTSLASPSYTNFALSILILFGILISYLPQHHRIISRRTSAGISPYFVLLGTTSGTCAFANILTLPASRADLACCADVSGFECAAGLLGIAQVGVQWSCFAVILLLFLIFFPKATPPLPPTSHQPSYRTALLIALTCTFHALAVLLISTAVLYLSPQHLQPWANTLGIFATALAAVQFLPQLVTTWRLQAAGSLSVPTMFIQTPGSFVWAGSLAARLGPAGWSTWGIYLVTGCLQGGLLAMCIGFGVRDWRERERKKKGGEGEGEGEGEDQGEGNGRAMDGENTALLGNER